MGSAMKFDMKYGNHIPVLVKVLPKTSGNVLEMGTGLYSTPLLHWMCVPNNRYLVSMERKPRFFDMVKQYEHEFHQIVLVENWENADIEKPWDVVFVDHEPGGRRKEDIKRLANWVNYLIIHDSDWRGDKIYHYKEIFPLFKYRWNFTFSRPWTSVLSNFVDVEKELC